MGKNDIYLKRYLSDKKHFADLFNAAICRGEEILTSEEMREINGTSEVVLKEQNGKERSVHVYRDIMMETSTGEKVAVNFCLVYANVTNYHLLLHSYFIMAQKNGME